MLYFSFAEVEISSQSWHIIKHAACLNPLSANPTKWSNSLKQFVGNFPTNCLSVFDHFVILALKESKAHRSLEVITYGGLFVPFSWRVKLRGHMSTYETILRSINPCVDIWSYIAQYEPYDNIWNHMTIFGIIWTMSTYETTLRTLNSYVDMWFKLRNIFQYVDTWFILRNRLICRHMVHIAQYGFIYRYKAYIAQYNLYVDIWIF